MLTGRLATRLLFGLMCLAFAPATAWAQSAIAGVVKDTSGAVMPGVTIEVASPALIEKVRSVVSDGQGQYKIVDLRPGVYSITFTLPGFNTVKRDGVELPTNFTATINADLRVGALEETVTVSGASPVVDVQNAVQQVVLSRQVLDAVPTGRSIPTLGALLPGARLALPDVGGTSGMQNRDLTVHGSDGRDTTFQVDGMTLNGIEGDGSVQSYFNEAMFEEISYQTSAINAEVSAGGVRANMIPKDGGNQFKGTMFFSGANQSLQSDNSEDAKAKGLAAPDALNKVWDFNASEGGPIKKDKLWFFASYRDWGVYQYIANSFYKNGDQTIDDANIRSGVVRLTRAAELEEQGRGLPRSHPQVPRPRELVAGRLRGGRGSDRHPRPEAVLHHRSEVDEHGQQQAAARSRHRHQQRELYARAGARGRRPDPAPRHDSADRLRRLRRRLLLPRADPPHVRHLGVLRHRIARVQGRACSTGGATSGGSAVKWPT